jgi:hypothetical protein
MRLANALCRLAEFARPIDNDEAGDGATDERQIVVLTLGL